MIVVAPVINVGIVVQNVIQNAGNINVLSLGPVVQNAVQNGLNNAGLTLGAG